MHKEDVLERVVSVVSEYRGVSGDEWDEDTRLVEDCGLDSLDVVELLMAFEDEFDANAPLDAEERVRTLGDVVGVVCAVLGK